MGNQTIDGDIVRDASLPPEKIEVQATGTVLGNFSGSDASPSPQSEIPFSILPDIANNTLLGNSSGGSAAPSAQTSVGYMPVTATGSTTARTLADRFADDTNVKDFGAAADGSDDQPEISSAITSAISSGSNVKTPAGTYTLGSNITPVYGTYGFKFSPGALFSGAGNINLATAIPYQVGPSMAYDFFSKQYDTTFDYYTNIFSRATSIKTTSASAAVVADFGQGEAAGATSRAWGGNFVGVASASGATSIGVEIDTDVLVSGGIGYGLVIAGSGSFPSQNLIQLQANNNNAIPTDGIVFSSSSRTAVSGALIKAIGNNLAPTHGLRFGGAYSIAEIDFPSFAVLSTPASIDSKISIKGSASSGPAVRAAGTGTVPATTANLNLEALNGGNVQLNTDANGPTQVKIKHVASAVNTLVLRGSATGNSVSIATEGSDTAPPLNFAPLGGITVNGNMSKANIGSTGIAFAIPANTYTDTASTGTVGTLSIIDFAAPTVAASSATTFSNASTLRIGGVPVAGSNVTLTNARALDVTGASVFRTGLTVTGGALSASGGTVALNANSNNNVQIGTGTSTGAVTIGGGSGTIGFNGSAAISKPEVSGSRAGNAALASLLTQLANYGLITDSTSA